MKLKVLLNFIFSFLVLATLFHLQYNANASAGLQKEYSIVSHQPESPSDSSRSPLPFNTKDLIRLELLLLFLFLLVYFAFTFSIFQFPSVKIWIPGKTTLPCYDIQHLKDRAPPR